MSQDAGLALARIAEQVKQQVAKAQELQMVLLSTQVEGTAADGQVVVRVGVNGAPVAIELDPKVMRMAPDELARAITSASSEATSALERRSQDLVAQMQQIDMQAIVRDLQRQFEPPPPVPTPEADEFATSFPATLIEEAERARAELAEAALVDDDRPKGVSIDYGSPASSATPTAGPGGGTPRGIDTGVDDGIDDGWYDDGPAQR